MMRRGCAGLSITNERGFALLLLCYLVALFLMTVGTAASVVGTNALRVAQRHSQLGQAFHLAETGLDRALVQLRSGNTNSIATTSFGNGNYSATITPPPLGQTVPYVIDATGQVNGVSQQVSAVVEAIPMGRSFPGALFGDEWVLMDGSFWVDSYRSSVGESSRRQRGDVLTNATQGDVLKLHGSIRVEGDLVTGIGSDTRQTIRITGSALITGRQRAASTPVLLTDPQVPAGCHQHGRVELHHGETLTLHGGNHCFEKLKITGGTVRLAAGHRAEFYVGRLEVKGNGRIGEPGDRPTNLIINVTGRSDSVLIEGGGTVRAALYAPRSRALILGSGFVYGAIVAEEIVARGSALVHFDEDLRSLEETSSSRRHVQFKSWRVNRPPITASEETAPRSRTEMTVTPH